MKTKLFIILLAAMVAMATLSAYAQDNTGTVKGTVIGEDNKPIADATVRLTSADGKKIDVKTDSNGQFTKTGVPAGPYKATLLVKGEPKWESSMPITVTAGQAATDIPINLAATEQLQKMTPEQRKALEEQRAKQEAERNKIKNLNGMIVEARQADAAGDFDKAIGLMTQATQADATKDLLWYELGAAYLGKATKSTDKAETTEAATKAVDAIQKAIAIKPDNAKYHNNLGQAYARQGNTELAVKEYTQAGQMDPQDAAMYYFNAGAVLTNVAMKSTGAEHKKQLGDANEMFRKSTAANPNYSSAEAYYQLGSNLFGEATLASDGKMVVPQGTAEAYNKYLELAPNGRYADAAKGALAAMGSKVETTYKSGKKK